MARKKLRSTRRPLALHNAYVVGDTRHRSIVYGYGFASRPGLIKVGYSSRGVERIREQTTGFPEPPQVVFVLHHPDAAAIEGRVHTALKHCQDQDTVGVEWFRAGFEDVVAACSELRVALGRERWRARWRWVVVLLAVLLGLVAAPVIGAVLDRPSAPPLVVGPYVQALLSGQAAAWRLAFQEGWRLVIGPVGLELRLVALLFPMLAAWLVFGRRS